MPNGTYGGVRGKETKVGQKTFVSRPTRFAILMIPNGQATHDFFNLELRHHQYAEIIAIIISYLCYRCKYITTF